MTEFTHLNKEETRKIKNEKIKEEKYLSTDDDSKNKKLKESKVKKIDIYIFISIIISIILYKLSLKGCDGTQSYCLVTLSPGFFYLLGLYMAICALIFSIIITMMLYKKVSIKHLFYIIPIYIYMLYFYDKGSDLSKHGSYNKMVFYFLLAVFAILISIILLLAYLKRKKYNKILFFIFLIFISSILYSSFKLRYGCKKWFNGLNGMRVINDEKYDKCYIVHPHKCWINMIDGIFDVSRILGEDCQNFRGGERQELLKYLPKRFNNSFNLAYPITTKYTWLNQSHYDRFFKVVMNDFIDLDKDNYYNNENKPEILLNFNPITELGTIKIIINRNEKLVKEREEIFNKLPKEKIPRYKNFLFIYIDAISRPHFVRKMKHTQNFLKQYYNSNEKSFYQMLKYQSFIYFTPPNVNPMFYGESMFNSNGTHIIKAFKERGYITGQSNDICSRELYDLENDYTANMTFEDFDHENIAMMCDPNFYNLENPFTPYLGPYSIRRRCLYGRDTFDYVLDYGEKFWDAYKNERKFLRVAFQDAHEGTGEVVRYLDERLEIFLNSFKNKGYLNDTAIFIVSDHGNNMIGFYNIFQVEDFVLEKTLGSWFILLPRKGEIEKERNSLLRNQQRYVTPYDIHDSMLYLFGFEKGSEYHSRYGQSVFEDIDGLSRDCDTYKYDLKPLWCRCVTYE